MTDKTQRPGVSKRTQPEVIPPVNTSEVSCLNVKAVYDYVNRKSPEKVDRLFENLPGQYADLPNPAETLTDENNWISSELIEQMFKNARELLGDPEAPYHIGFESITERNFGYIQKFFISTFGSPMGVLKRINQVNSQFNATKIVETIYGSPSRAVVRLHWKEHRYTCGDVCRYNRGIYAAIPTVFGLPPSTIEEPFCYFDGDPYCQFNIRFYLRRKPLKRIIDFFHTRKSQLLSALEQIETDKMTLKRKYDEVNMLNRELADKIEKLKAINTASTLLVSHGNTEEILHTTMRFIINALQFDRGIVMLINDDQTHLEYRYAFGADPRMIERHLQGYSIPLTREENILARVATLGKPTLVKDAEIAGLHLENRILRYFDVSSFVICPLPASDGIIGILAADRYQRNKLISSEELDDLSIFANTIAETLHKAQLTEEIEQSYLNTVRALVRAIEEKDAYTRGHSERVATLSVGIGEELGLPEKELEFIRTGCLLHDVGKIGITEKIVNSPNSLTDEEYGIVKQHPLKGTEIVQPVGFREEPLSIIRNHHERFDGTGYPDGLGGDDIPLGAQIASLADAYDAMTSTRPYRKGLPPGEAFRRIQEAKGTQFAPAVVEAFSRLYRANGSEQQA